MTTFSDLLNSNKEFAQNFELAGFDGIAGAGVAMVTCMDSRIDPLGMIGLVPGDAKILRNPGGRVTDQALVALVLSVHLLNVDRILVVEHTKCAMGSSTEAELRQQVSDAAGMDASWMSLGVIDDQREMLRADVQRVRSHPLIAPQVSVGGFLYDVDSGLLDQVC